MARQRIIKPDFFTDEDLAACSPHARLLFPGLWMLADRRGRLKDQPAVIRGAVFPYEPEQDADLLLNELEERGFVQRYEVDGRRFIQIPTFEKHQRPHPKEAESVIPPVPDGYEKAVELHGTAAKRLDCKSSLPVVPSFLRSFVPSKPSDNAPSDISGSAPPEPVAAPVQIAPKGTPWLAPYFDAWHSVYPEAELSGKAGELAKVLRPLDKKHGSERVALELVAYLRATPIEYVNLGKFAAAFGTWAKAQAPARASPRSTPSERTMAAVARFVERRRRDAEGEEVAGVGVGDRQGPCPPGRVDEG